MEKVVIGDCELYLGDCLERMKEIPDGSVDMVLTDPPYGTMKGAGLDGWHDGKTDWDTVIDSKLMWHEINRVLRVNSCCILFSQEPYTSKLITQGHNNVPFSYRMTWVKDHFANALVAKKAPVSYTEDVLVFFKNHTKHDFHGFHPLRDYAKKVMDKAGMVGSEFDKFLGHQRANHFFRIDSTQFGLCTEATYNELTEKFNLSDEPWFLRFAELASINAIYRRDLIDKMTSEFPKVFNLPDGAKYKSNVLEYRKDYSGHHPAQKPVALLADLMETYANEGDTVLDFTAGSMSTAIACINTNRKGIMIEKDEHYFKVGSERVERALSEKVKPQNGKLEL